MSTRMHPLFAELFLDQPGDQQDDDTRRARARRARRRQAAKQAQTVRPRPASGKG